MKRVLGTGLLLGAAYVALSLASGVAWAGEKLLGRILVSDGGSANNFNTGYLVAGCANSTITGPGSCDQPFKVPTQALISVQCDQAAVVSVGVPWVDAGNGIKVAADQFFTSSSGALVTYKGAGGSTDDAGTYSGGVVSIAPQTVTSAVARCRVFQRQGNE